MNESEFFLEPHLDTTVTYSLRINQEQLINRKFTCFMFLTTIALTVLHLSESAVVDENFFVIIWLKVYRFLWRCDLGHHRKHLKSIVISLRVPFLLIILTFGIKKLKKSLKFVGFWAAGTLCYQTSRSSYSNILLVWMAV